MLLRDLVANSAKALEAAGVASAVVDAEILLAFTLGISRSELQLKLVMNESIEEPEAFEKLLARRIAREPLQHLTGVAYFRNLELKVGKGVFVPRPETELLAGFAIDAALKLENPIVVDLCAGSGAVGIAVATEVPTARVWAVELSKDAIEYARENYRSYAPRATLIHGDAAAGIPELNGQVDVLVSNPPYIPEAMVPIYPEVALHDPKLALYSGADGLELIRKLSRVGLELVKPGGVFAMEHADSQSEAISQLLLADGWQEVVDVLDLNGKPRMVTAKR
jgi:release factor glutamine methyltransferase